MNTHIVYAQAKRSPKVYFSGRYGQDLTVDGYADIEWEWSCDREDAKEFVTTDAWDLLSIARITWPNANIQVERIQHVSLDNKEKKQ